MSKGWIHDSFEGTQDPTNATSGFTGGFKMTPEGGFAVQMINHTGAPSVKGQIVIADVGNTATQISPAPGPEAYLTFGLHGANYDTNTDSGTIYYAYTDTSGGVYLVEFFSDAGMTELVASATATAGSGSVMLIEENSSGITGWCAVAHEGGGGDPPSATGSSRVPITGGFRTYDSTIVLSGYWGGIVYENAVAEGGHCWVVISGIADVLANGGATNYVNIGEVMDVDVTNDGEATPYVSNFGKLCLGQALEGARRADSGLIRTLLRWSFRIT